MTEVQKTSGIALWGMVTILFLAGAIAISQINKDAVWFDEQWTYRIVNGGQYLSPRNPPEIIEYMMRSGETWPPFYNLAFAGWGALTGWSVYTHRIMAWLFGLLGISATYRLGVTISRKTSYQYCVGLIAAGLLSTSAFYIYYMHEMRGYTMSVFFTTMSVWLYWRLINGKTKRTLLILFIFFNVCVLYTHYIPALMLMSMGLFHLMLYRRLSNSKWQQIIKAFAYSILVFAPWTVPLLFTLSNESQAPRGLSPFTALSSMLNGYGNGLWIVLPLLLGITAWYVRKRSAFYLCVVSLGFIVFALIANYPLQYLFHIRHTMSLIPVVLTLVSLGIVTVYCQNDTSTLVRLGVTVTLLTWIASGLWYSFDRQLMNSLPGARYVISTDTIKLVKNISHSCIDQNDKSAFHLTNNYRKEWLYDTILLHYLWTDVPFEYANLNKLRYIPDQYDLRRPLVRINTQEPTDYTERVRWYTGDSDRIWLFSRSDLPRDEKIAEFESVLQQDYAICGRVQSQAGLDVYVWSNTSSPTCELLGNVSLAPCTNDIVKVSPNETDGESQ